MGLKDSLVTMMGDFVELRRNPDFRSKTDLSNSEPPDPRKFNPNRRHSLQITCGTQDSQPEKMVHQRTFSVHQQKVSPRQNDSPLDSVSLRHHQDSLQHRRYKHRRASEPLNLIGFGLGWTRGSDKKKRQKLPPPSQSPFAYEDEASSPPASPASSIGGGGRSPAANSFSKSGAAANYPSRFFAHQHTIEESEEWEIDMDGQRRQSTSKRPQQQPIVEQQRYATVIRL